MPKIENMPEETPEVITEDASLVAASDTSAQIADMKAEEETSKNINDVMPFTVPLSKIYDIGEGKEISEIDLSGLSNLTTADAEFIDRVMDRLNHHPRDKFRDSTYTKHIAMKVTNLPIEFFNTITWKDMNQITSRIALYFLF